MGRAVTRAVGAAVQALTLALARLRTRLVNWRASRAASRLATFVDVHDLHRQRAIADAERQLTLDRQSRVLRRSASVLRWRTVEDAPRTHMAPPEAPR